MSMRISILGRYQGLDSDETTTGAICIAGQARGRVHGRNWLLQGDKTTPCPGCGQPGTLVEGEPYWSQDGIPTVLDGALVACGCPIGSNRVIAGGSAALATSGHLHLNRSMTPCETPTPALGRSIRSGSGTLRLQWLSPLMNRVSTSCRAACRMTRC